MTTKVSIAADGGKPVEIKGYNPSTGRYLGVLHTVDAGSAFSMHIHSGLSLYIAEIPSSHEPAGLADLEDDESKRDAIDAEFIEGSLWVVKILTEIQCPSAGRNICVIASDLDETIFFAISEQDVAAQKIDIGVGLIVNHENKIVATLRSGRFDSEDADEMRS